MADEKDKKPNEPGFADILRAFALGISPSAPRIPEGAMLAGGSAYGGFQKGYGSRDTFRGAISFPTLRQLAVKSPMLSAINSKRKFQGTRYARVASRSKKNDVGFNIRHRLENESNFKVEEGFQNLCKTIEQSFLKPWTLYWNEGVVERAVEPSLAGFMSKIIDDHLIINRPCVELGLDINGVPRAFGAIDGANVLPTFSTMKFFAKKIDFKGEFEQNSQRYAELVQKVSDKFGVHIDEDSEYIYLMNGRPYASYTSKEIIVAPFFPVTDVKHAGYPKSLTEQAIYILLSEINAMTANARFFETGSMTESLIAMKGSYTDEHIKQLTDILQANMSGVAGMFKVPLVALPGGAQDLNVIPIKSNHRDMLFDVYIQKLTNLACAVFSMHPSEINEAPKAGDNSGGLQQATQTLQISMNQEQGLQVMLQHIKTEIFDPILHRIDPDLVMEWDYGENEAQQLALINQYAPITKVNERRAMAGLDPLTDEEGGNVVDNTFIQSAKAAAQQQEMAAEQQAAGNPPGSGPSGPGSQGPAAGGGDDSSQG